MEDQIARLYGWWHRLGGKVLLARPPASGRPPPQEEVILATTAWARYDGRLPWILLEWLTRNGDRLRVEKLLTGLENLGEEPVLGVLCEAAYRRNSCAGLKAVFARCEPQRPTEYFFHRIRASGLRGRIARENSLPLFRKWGFWCDELDYLDKAGPDRSVRRDRRAVVRAVIPSKTRRSILGYLVDHSSGRVQEIVKAEGLSYMPAYTELRRLAACSVVLAERGDKSITYSLNPDSPVYSAIRLLFSGAGATPSGVEDRRA